MVPGPLSAWHPGSHAPRPWLAANLESFIREVQAGLMTCPDGIDPRMPRFGQALTGVTLAAGFLLSEPLLVVLVAVVLAGAALGGPRWSLWAYLYKLTFRPLVGPPTELEDPRGPRFAKQLGFVFSATASALLFTTVGVLETTGWAIALLVSGLALFAAVTGFCVACQFYGLYSRLNRTPAEA